MPQRKADIIRAVFAAYLANDRSAIEHALADDFRFTSPYDDHIDKATYFERSWRCICSRCRRRPAGRGRGYRPP